MKHKVSSIKTNMIMNTLLQVSSILLPLIIFPYVSRVLLPEGLGKVSFALSLTNYFIMFAQLGIPTYGIVVCAKVRDDREKLSQTVQELLVISMISCAAVYAVFTVALLTIPVMRENTVLYMVVGTQILLNALGVEWLYQALEKFTYISIRSVFFKVVALVMTFMFVKSPDDCIIYGAVAIFAASASNILNLMRLKEFVSFSRDYKCDLRHHMRAIMTFLLITISITIYTNLDSVMLGFMKGEAVVGYYTVAVKVKLALANLLIAINHVLLPRVSHYLENNRIRELEPIVQHTTKLMLEMSVPLTIYFIYFADVVVRILAGTQYGPAVPAMMIIMPTLILIGLSSLYGSQILVPMGREREIAWSTLLGMVVDLVLNIMLIGKFGAAGAAFSTLMAEMAVLVYVLMQMDKPLLASGFRKVGLVRLIVGNVLALIAAVIMKSTIDNDLILIALSVPFYWGLYGLIVMRDEMRMVLGMFFKR